MALQVKVRDLLAIGFAADGRLPDAINEEDFLAAPEAALSSGHPSTEECCARIHERCVLDAVNEALEILLAPRPPPRGLSAGGMTSSERLTSLAVSAVEQHVARLSLEESTAQVLALIHTPSDDPMLPDDVGAATRMLWHQLAPEWTEYGQDDYEAARAQLHRSPRESSNGDGCAEEALAKLAADIFWEKREALLLTGKELHCDLWEALCRHISPPWPDDEIMESVSSPAAKGRSTAGVCRSRCCHGRIYTEDSSDSKSGNLSGEDDEHGQHHADNVPNVERSPMPEIPRGVHRIHYDDYLQALSELENRKVAPLRSARAFLAMHLDGYGRASIYSLYAVACALTQLLQTRVQLAMLEDARGRLTEPALETFIKDSIPRMPRLAEHTHLQPGHSFLPFYVAHCVRKLHLLLEPKDKRGVPVDTLLLSAELAQFFALSAEERRADDNAADDESNWFSLASAIRTYRQFLDLDADQDGMLSAEELMHYAEGLMTLTPAFVRRLFEVVHTYDGRLDYKGYLDFVISCEHRSHPACLAYLFRALDLHSRGYIGVFEVNYFVRDIVQGLLDTGDEPPDLSTIVDEVFDLAKMRKPTVRKYNRGRPFDGFDSSDPMQPPRITRAELQSCGAGAIIVQMLIDVQGFWNWDNREQLIEYDDDDRYERDQRAAACAVTMLFSHAVRRKVAPSRDEVAMPDLGSDVDGTTQRFYTTRTIRALLRNLSGSVDTCGEPPSKPVVTRVIANAVRPQRPGGQRIKEAPSSAAKRTFTHELVVSSLQLGQAETNDEAGYEQLSAQVGAVRAGPIAHFIIPPLPTSVAAVKPQDSTVQRAQQQRPTIEEAPPSEVTKDRPVSSRRRSNSSLTPCMAATPSALRAPAHLPALAATQAALQLNGNMSADDVLLWLQTSAFKKRGNTVAASIRKDSEIGAKVARRARIIDEVHIIKERMHGHVQLVMEV